MGLPNYYQNSGDSPLTSYDFVDIAEGTGIITLYGGENEDNSGVYYTLNKNTFYSQEPHTKSAAITATSATKMLDLDFDLSPLALQKTLKGTMLCNVPFSVKGESQTITGYLVIRLRKWNGTTETEIANVQTSNITAGVGVQTLKMMCAKITVPKTLYKVGETIRVTVEAWAYRAAGAPGNDPFCWIGHDPSGRVYDIWTGSDSYKTSTRCAFYIPSKIDL